MARVETGQNEQAEPNMLTTTEGEMARQTEQAKMLREIKDRLELTNKGLADLFDVEAITIQTWLLPKESPGYRHMKGTSKALLDIYHLLLTKESKEHPARVLLEVRISDGRVKVRRLKE